MGRARLAQMTQRYRRRPTDSHPPTSAIANIATMLPPKNHASDERPLNVEPDPVGGAFGVGLVFPEVV